MARRRALSARRWGSCRRSQAASSSLRRWFWLISTWTYCSVTPWTLRRRTLAARSASRVTHGPAVADAPDVLGRVEGVDRRRTGDSRQGAVGLGGVLDDGRPDGEQRCDVGRPAVQVDDDDGLRPGGDRRRRCTGVERGRRVVDVGEDGNGARRAHRRCRRHGRERGHDDLVTRTDTECRQRQLQGAGATGDPHDVAAGRRAVDRGIELGLEGRQLGSEQHGPGFEDAPGRRSEVRLEATVTSPQVDDGDHDRST